VKRSHLYLLIKRQVWGGGGEGDGYIKIHDAHAFLRSQTPSLLVLAPKNVFESTNVTFRSPDVGPLLISPNNQTSKKNQWRIQLPSA
jgi:hypothetical protein